METSFLLNRHHTYYDGKNIKLQIYTIKDCSVKQKEYEQYQGRDPETNLKSRLCPYPLQGKVK